jgi:hypothetical protein
VIEFGFGINVNSIKGITEIVSFDEPVSPLTVPLSGWTMDSRCIYADYVLDSSAFVGSGVVWRLR